MDKDSIPIPTSPTGTQLFSHQIAGHNDILLLSPTVLAKPVTETELSFYLDAQDPQHSAVRGYMPEFGGEVTFPNPDPNGPLQLRYFKLENLLAEFTSPCVLDVKLGTRLYDSDASEEKREKMRGQAESTTSGVVGVRVCGMKVWNHATGEFVQTDRDYLRKLKPEQLSSVLWTFFRRPSDGAFAFRNGIPPILSELKGIQRAVSAERVSLIASSILIVYEGLETDSDSPRTLVKIIDFAHSKFLKESEVDEETGYLFGMGNLCGMLEELLDQLPQ